MRRKKWIFFVAPPGVVLFVTLFGFIVKWLWNWLLPAIFTGAHLITFWQALGLLLLTRILFGSWHGGGKGNKRRHRREQWEAMTPEEREKFRQGMRGRCGNFGEPPAESTRPA
jgi:hypothetical protein